MKALEILGLNATLRRMYYVTLLVVLIYIALVHAPKLIETVAKIV